MLETAYACPAWEFAADTHLLKLQRLQNRVLQNTDNFPRCTNFPELQVPYVYEV
jgi:hypothetical protein